MANLDTPVIWNGIVEAQARGTYDAELFKTFHRYHMHIQKLKCLLFPTLNQLEHVLAEVHHVIICSPEWPMLTLQANGMGLLRLKQEEHMMMSHPTPFLGNKGPFWSHHNCYFKPWIYLLRWVTWWCVAWSHVQYWPFRHMVWDCWGSSGRNIWCWTIQNLS